MTCLRDTRRQFRLSCLKTGMLGKRSFFTGIVLCVSLVNSVQAEVVSEGLVLLPPVKLGEDEFLFPTAPIYDAAGNSLTIGAFPFSLQLPLEGPPSSLIINNVQKDPSDVTGITGVSRVVIGNRTPGALTIDGRGAFLEGPSLTQIGYANAATLQILNGARYSGERTILGLETSLEVLPIPKDVSVRVDGLGSIFETQTLDIGGWSVPTTAQVDVTVSNGGVLSAEPTPDLPITANVADIKLGTGTTVNDRLLVTGDSSRVEATGVISLISDVGSDRIDVLDGGSLVAKIADQGGFIFVGGFQNTAELLVSGEGSLVRAEQEFHVGLTRFNEIEGDLANYDGRVRVENNGRVEVLRDIIVDRVTPFSGPILGDPVKGELIVSSGGTVSAQNIFVNAGGTISGAGGTFIGDVFVDGGSIAPGASPGTLTIDGDANLQGASINFEIGGTGLGEFDKLVVTGDLFADEDTVFTFSLVNDFVLSVGDNFNILEVFGHIDIGQASFLFEGLGTGVQASVSGPAAGQISLNIQSIGSSTPKPTPVPVPATMWLLLASLAGLGVFRGIGKMKTA